ncbi:MAG: hypothetical protein ACXWEF_07990 [Solirubrobacterales bacterium]
MRRRIILAALSVTLLAAAAAGCGSREFSADGFVDDVNGNGAELDLGEQLPTNQPGKTLYEVELGRAAGETAGGSGEGDTTGTLTVYDDTGVADRGTAECEAAAGLLCFQAGNVVLYFEGDRPGPTHLRLAAAIKKLAE